MHGTQRCSWLLQADRGERFRTDRAEDSVRCWSYDTGDLPPKQRLTSFVWGKNPAQAASGMNSMPLCAGTSKGWLTI